MGKKIEVQIKGYVNVYPVDGSCNFGAVNMESQGWPLIKEVDIVHEIVVPDDFDMRKLQVEGLNKKAAAIEAELGGKLRVIRQQIANLLCIENSVAEVAE
jgi:ribosomal protein L29